MSAVQVFRKYCGKRRNCNFYLFEELSSIFVNIKTVVCKLSVWKSLKFVVREMVIHKKRMNRRKAMITLNYITSYSFLAHLSTLCSGGAIVTGHRPASVRPSVCPSVCPLTISLKIFSSKTRRPILIKLGRNVPWVKLYKNC